MSSAAERRIREACDEAAAWVIREDRGLSAEEQDRLSQWLAADPAHREAWARQRGNWRRLEPLARWLPEHSAEPNPDLLAPSRRKRRWWRPSLALAASVAGLNASQHKYIRPAKHPHHIWPGLRSFDQNLPCQIKVSNLPDNFLFDRAVADQTADKRNAARP